MTLLKDAQALGERGFRVHPLRTKSQPLTKYSQTATSDPDAIARLFAPFPDALIGICTGHGLVVVDDDRGLDEPDPSMPVTLTARTANRGWHHYFYCSTPIRNSASKVAPGIDIRGEGGYVVAPPSAGYAWARETLPPVRIFEHPAACDMPWLARLPALLLAACLKQEHAASTFEPKAHVPAGERHDYLIRAAGWMLANELATADTLTAELLLHASQVCEPWPLSELPGVRKHIRDICRWVIDREAGGQ